MEGDRGNGENKDQNVGLKGRGKRKVQAVLFESAKKGNPQFLRGKTPTMAYRAENRVDCKRGRH